MNKDTVVLTFLAVSGGEIRVEFTPAGTISFAAQGAFFILDVKQFHLIRQIQLMVSER